MSVEHINLFTSPQYEALRRLRSDAMSAWANAGSTNNELSNTLWSIYQGLDNLIAQSLGLENITQPNPMTSPRDKSS